MAMTARVKDELSRLTVTKPCCRKAEVATTLRFAGGLHIVGGRIVVEAELDTAAAARRLRKDITDVYGHSSEILVLSPGGLRRGSRYVVGVNQDGEALALVGAARRIGVQSKAREVRGVDRVVIRDGDTIGAMLTRLGAHDAVLAWEERRMRREVRATANRLANFDDANLRRSARAAVAAGSRVERAMEILGVDVPEHLRAAGSLRLEHKQASLEELGQLADPPMTKDAVAGRIRRLLAMADKRAIELGIPGTEANLTPDMLDA